MSKTDQTPTTSSTDAQTPFDDAADAGAGAGGAVLEPRLERLAATASPCPDKDDVGMAVDVSPAGNDCDTLVVSATVIRSDVPIFVRRVFEYDAWNQYVTDTEHGYVDGVEVYSVERDTAEFRPHFRVAAEPFEEPVTLREYADAFAFAEPTWAVGGNFHRQLGRQRASGDRV